MLSPTIWAQLLPSELDANTAVRGHAAVLLALTGPDDDPSLLLTRRADHLKSHPGQVAFPGGYWEPEDASLADTALREAWEEVALPPEQVSIKGALRALPSRNAVPVQPFVGRVLAEPSLRANPEEIAEIFYVPLRYFMENPPDRMDRLTRSGREFEVPAWYVQGYEIWGLTAMFLSDMLRTFRA